MSKQKYESDLPRRMYLYFTEGEVGGSVPSFSKFARRIGVTLDELKSTWMAKLSDNCLFISARERTNIDNLKDVIYKRVCELHVQKYPYNDFLYQTYDEE